MHIGVNFGCNQVKVQKSLKFIGSGCMHYFSHVNLSSFSVKESRSSKKSQLKQNEIELPKEVS